MAYGEETQGEMISKVLGQEGRLQNFPFAYQGERHLFIGNLTEKGQAHCSSLVLQMIKELGVDLIQGFLFELKFEEKK